MKTLILASASPRRRALLQKLGLPFVVRAMDVDERVDEPPERAVVCLAERKARAVAGTLDEGLVIGADTLVSLDGRALGKPADAAEAKAMLRALSGRRHEVYTGVCVLDVLTGRALTRAECARVRFRDLSETEIEAYVASGEPMDKAGAYAIQGGAGAFVAQLEGAFENVMGLPIDVIPPMIEQLMPV